MKAGWQAKRLGEVSVINYGYTEKASRDPIGPKFLRITDIQDDAVCWDTVPYCKIPSDKLENFRLNHNDVVFARTGATTGKSFLVKNPPPSVFASYLIRLQLKSADLLPEFLILFFQTPDYWNTVQEGTAGSAQGGFNASKLADLITPIPSIEEQKRIVSILDEAFEGIATAKVSAEQNLKNVRAIFESKLDAVFGQQGGKDWVKTTLGAEINLLVGFAFKSAKYTASEHDIRLLRGDNIIQGSIRWDDVKRWPVDDVADYEKYWLRENDIVLAMDRPIVKAGIKRAKITSQDLPCLLVQRTACLRSGPMLDYRYLMYLVGSTKFVSHISGVQTGIGVPHISGGQIQSLIFFRPPLKEQQQISENLDTLLEEVQRLESIYRQKIAALDELKKSLLHQAFSGTL